MLLCLCFKHAHHMANPTVLFSARKGQGSFSCATAGHAQADCPVPAMGEPHPALKVISCSLSSLCKESTVAASACAPWRLCYQDAEARSVQFCPGTGNCCTVLCSTNLKHHWCVEDKIQPKMVLCSRVYY